MRISVHGVDWSENNEYPLPDPDQIELCENWLKENSTARKTNRIFSYALKHIVEENVGTYISNGAAIQAAINIGYHVSFNKRDKHINADIHCISPFEPDAWKRVRPTGFSRWLFNYSGPSYSVSDLGHDGKLDERWPRRAEEFWEFHQYVTSWSNGEDWEDAFMAAWGEYTGCKVYRETDFPIDDIAVHNEWDDSGKITVISVGDSFPKSPSGSTYLYAIFEDDKIEGRNIVYVGKSKTPSQRLKQHIRQPVNRKMYAWIIELESRGELPKMVVFDCIDDSQVNHAEKAAIYWISRATSRYDMEHGFQRWQDALLNTQNA